MTNHTIVIQLQYQKVYQVVLDVSALTMNMYVHTLTHRNRLQVTREE
jgi:hypothetical protein